jgi:hypothetical protein
MSTRVLYLDKPHGVRVRTVQVHLPDATTAAAEAAALHVRCHRCTAPPGVPCVPPGAVRCDTCHAEPTVECTVAPWLTTPALHPARCHLAHALAAQPEETTMGTTYDTNPLEPVFDRLTPALDSIDTDMPLPVALEALVGAVQRMGDDRAVPDLFALTGLAAVAVHALRVALDDDAALNSPGRVLYERHGHTIGWAQPWGTLDPRDRAAFDDIAADRDGGAS